MLALFRIKNDYDIALKQYGEALEESRALRDKLNEALEREDKIHTQMNTLAAFYEAAEAHYGKIDGDIQINEYGDVLAVVTAGID